MLYIFTVTWNGYAEIGQFIILHENITEKNLPVFQFSKWTKMSSIFEWFPVDSVQCYFEIYESVVHRLVSMLMLIK